MATATERVFLASPTTGSTNPALAAPWLFTGEDNLRLVVINSQSNVTVTFDGRQLNDGDTSPTAFTQSFTPTADRLPNTFDFAFGSGFLLNCSLIVSSGSPLVGQTYCMLQVIRGLRGATIVLGCLLGGYVTAMQHLAYPGSPIKSSTEDEPFVRVVSGTTPAAGLDISEVVPTGARWELLMFRAVLTTSGAAGVRTPQFKISAPGGLPQLAICIPAVTVGPGTFIGQTWSPNMPSATATNRSQQSFPSLSIMPAGTQFGTNSVALDAADQWAGVGYLVREWLEAA